MFVTDCCVNSVAVDIARAEMKLGLAYIQVIRQRHLIYAGVQCYILIMLTAALYQCSKLSVGTSQLSFGACIRRDLGVFPIAIHLETLT